MQFHVRNTKVFLPIKFARKLKYCNIKKHNLHSVISAYNYYINKTTYVSLGIAIRFKIDVILLPKRSH